MRNRLNPRFQSIRLENNAAALDRQLTDNAWFKAFLGGDGVGLGEVSRQFEHLGLEFPGEQNVGVIPDFHVDTGRVRDFCA